MEAEITVEYNDAHTAKAVGDAVSPDNHGTPEGLSVITRTENKKVVTSIECTRGLPTFISTIDDLLSSITVAEKSLRETITKQRTNMKV